MSQVNTNGVPVVDKLFATWGATPDPDECAEILLLLLNRMGLEAFSTNAAKSGRTEIYVREVT